MKIGAQLYTVREFTQTTKDFAGTIKKVADMGYNCVQVSGIGAEITATEIAEICKAHNVEVAITHTAPDRIKNETAQVIQDHITMGVKYIGVGAVPWGTRLTKEGYTDFVKDFTPAAKAIKEAGLQFMYHNHDFEFAKFDGKLAMDFLVENLPDTGFTLDTYWVQLGGGDPAWWIKKLTGRVDVIHIKDLVIVDGTPHMAEIFEGNLNWNAIFESCKTAGVKYAMVEQDECYGKDPFECLELSLRNLREYGFHN